MESSKSILIDFCRAVHGIESAFCAREDLRRSKRLINVAALMWLAVTAFAQEVQVDYDRSANFDAYKTYQWIDSQPVGRRPTPG